MATDINSFVSIKLINSELSSAASKILTTEDFIGASISVRCSSNYYWNKVLGSIEQNEKEKPLGFNHKFLIYSLTKTFTGVCILKLVEEGLFTLDTEVEQLLQDFPRGTKITVRHLLNHTSGLTDYGHLDSYKNAVKETPGKPWSKDRFVESISSANLSKPGEKWTYSNPGYMYLRNILEEQTNHSYKTLVTELITKPLFLTNTAVVESIHDLSDLVRSNSHQLSNNKEFADIRKTYHPNWCAPGLVSSTAQDVAKLYGTIFDTEFLSARAKKEMLKPIKVNLAHKNFKTPSYGMGLMIDPDNPLGLIAGHSGSGPGYSATCFARIQPGKDTICSCVLSNSENPEDLENVVLDLLSQFK